MNELARACLEKAEACLQAGKYAEARDGYQRALEQDSGCDEARGGLANVDELIRGLRVRHLWTQASGAKDPTAAAALYREILRVNPDDKRAAEALSLVVAELVRPLLEQAEAAFQAGRFSDARDEFQRVVDADAGCERACQGVAKAEEQMKLLRLAPLWRQAHEAEAQGDPKAAEPLYREILSLNPNDTKAAEALALVAGKLVQIHLERGKTRLQAGSFADALDAFRQALDLIPECAPARQGAAQAEAEIKGLRLRHLWNKSGEAEAREDFDAAEALYRQIVTLDPSHSQAHSAAEALGLLREATTLLRRGEYREALRRAKAVTKRGAPDSKAVAKARFLLGLRWDFWRWLAIAHAVGLLVARCVGPALEQRGFSAADYAWVPAARIGAGALLGFIAFAVGYFPVRARRIQESGLLQCYARPPLAPAPPVPAKKA